MQLKATKDGNILKVKITGELDHHTAKDFARQLDALIVKENIRYLELDLKGLTFMDSSGIGVILGRYKKLLARGGKLYVTNENKVIKKIFNLSGLYQIIERIG